MNRRILPFICVLIPLLSLACGPKVMIPPKIDLTKYENVGVIGFGCNAEGNMDEFATRRFLLRIRSYQKEARIIDLGSTEELLQYVQADQMDPEAIQAIGQKYDVDAIFTGNLEITEVKPLFKLYRGRTGPISGKTQVVGTRASAEIKVWVTANLWGTEQGTMLWRVSAHGDGMVDQVSVLSDEKVVFDARDPYKAFWDLVNPLVKKISADFKIKHKKIREN